MLGLGNAAPIGWFASSCLRDPAGQEILQSNPVRVWGCEEFPLAIGKLADFDICCTPTSRMSKACDLVIFKAVMFFFSPFFCATLCQVKKEFLKGKDWMRQYEFGFTSLMCKDFLSTSSSHPLLSNLKCCVELCVDQAIKSAAEEALNHVMTNINQRAMLPRELVSFDWRHFVGQSLSNQRN